MPAAGHPAAKPAPSRCCAGEFPTLLVSVRKSTARRHPTSLPRKANHSRKPGLMRSNHRLNYNHPSSQDSASTCKCCPAESNNAFSRWKESGAESGMETGRCFLMGFFFLSFFLRFGSGANSWQTVTELQYCNPSEQSCSRRGWKHCEAPGSPPQRLAVGIITCANSPGSSGKGTAAARQGNTALRMSLGLMWEL